MILTRGRSLPCTLGVGSWQSQGDLLEKILHVVPGLGGCLHVQDTELFGSCLEGLCCDLSTSSDGDENCQRCRVEEMLVMFARRTSCRSDPSCFLPER